MIRARECLNSSLNIKVAAGKRTRECFRHTSGQKEFSILTNYVLSLYFNQKKCAEYVNR